MQARLPAGYNRLRRSTWSSGFLAHWRLGTTAARWISAAHASVPCSSILLIHRGTIVPADRLIDDLYGSQPPPTAAKSLQAHVSRLRKALGGDGRLVTRGGGYLLDLAPDELDLDRFTALVDSGRRALAASEPEQAGVALEEALALRRGAPFQDVGYEDFAQDEISRIDELQDTAHELLFEARLLLGRHEEIVAELEQFVTQRPLRERPRAQLMLALYRCGTPGRSARRLPGRTPRARGGARYRPLTCVAGARAGDAQPGPASRQGARARRRAEGRDGATAAGRLAAGIFVGRERELSLLEDALADARAGRGRLVVLAGEAGIGKSRLADELAARAKVGGTRVLWGRCWEAGGAPAYWPWVQALRATFETPSRKRCASELGAARRSHISSRSCGSSTPTFLRLRPSTRRVRASGSSTPPPRSSAVPRRRRGSLIVLDDMHAADASSLLLLEFVATELADARVLVLATYRDPSSRQATRSRSRSPASPASRACASRFTVSIGRK